METLHSHVDPNYHFKMFKYSGALVLYSIRVLLILDAILREGVGSATREGVHRNRLFCFDREMKQRKTEVVSINFHQTRNFCLDF